MSYQSTTSQQSGSVMTSEEEDWEEYVQGGYHPVHIGDTFSDDRYVVVRKLGWGHFSTVWLAKDTRQNRHVALKVVKSAPRYTETALDEIKLLQRLISSDHTHPGRSHVIGFLDHFRHKGPNGTHVCMVFEVLGENLLGLIKRHQSKGVPMNLVKQIAKQILLGLDYMHRQCGVIHTDLKPENVLICIDDVEAIIQAELECAAQSTAPTKLVGVPPSRGRGGNQTPRSQSVFITGSQPLPSPSSSFGTSPMFDKFAFGMSRIADDDTKTGEQAQEESQSQAVRVDSADNAAERISKLDPSFGEKAQNSPHRPTAGPSLLSQQAPIPSPSPSKSPLGSTSANPPPSSPLAEGTSSAPPLSPESSRSRSASRSRSELMEGERITVKIADLGNATWTDHHFTDDIQTRQYRCPEVILGAKWGPSADMWSAACLIFELLTGGDYLFDPASGSRYSKDDDHMAQIIELMGEFPKSIAFSGKYSAEFFTRKGELRNIHKLRFWPLNEVLHDKYLLPRAEADLIASFLNPMLHLHPDKRAKASELVSHSFLDGIIVQGEVDQLDRVDREQRRKSNKKKNKKKTGDTTADEADALKPVDDAAVLGGISASVKPDTALRDQTAPKPNGVRAQPEEQ